ncbi:hypothetical protein HYDPIDRAFT_113579 [Hydnomerulius pinastri MD-312]|uniref:DUF6533 domain-containing protein n=1 Tax=Hydnomerulius pinastri MD-312 TaxID=994086 RepID=A0A0C9W7A9_9AGAM|nr:hypothetical protein HYDPIDRAFT_113579 [Hydnomerulius pinastri MD-312]
MSASDIAITLRYFKEIWYWQVAGGVALFYDYLLLIDREVGLIWKQKWTLVTLLYAVVTMGNINWTGQVSLVLYEIRVWAPCVYKIAMDGLSLCSQ